MDLGKKWGHKVGWIRNVVGEDLGEIGGKEWMWSIYNIWNSKWINKNMISFRKLIPYGQIWLHYKDAIMLQHTEINKCHTSYVGSQGQKSWNHLNRPLTKFNILSW